VDLRRRVDRIVVLREQVPTICRAPDRLVVLDASGAREDRCFPELIPVGLRREADRAPNARIARVVEAKLLVVEVFAARSGGAGGAAEVTRRPSLPPPVLKITSGA
jgi:hypothetical protein